MRNGSYITLNLGRFVPCNLSSYWGAEQDTADFAIKRAQEQEKTRCYEALINSDLRTRFCRKVARRLMQEVDAIRSRRKERQLTREEFDALSTLLEKHRYYSERFQYFLDKLDRSAEADVSRHFWYYDAETGEAVDEDTGRRYKA